MSSDCTEKIRGVLARIVATVVLIALCVSLGWMYHLRHRIRDMFSPPRTGDVEASIPEAFAKAPMHLAKEGEDVTLGGMKIRRMAAGQSVDARVAELAAQGWEALPVPEDVPLAVRSVMRKGDQMLMIMPGSGGTPAMECRLNTEAFAKQWGENPFDADSDFPGSDISAVGRPKNSVRTFSFGGEGGQAVVYRVEDGSDNAYRNFLRKLIEDQWTLWLDDGGQTACLSRGESLCWIRRADPPHINTEQIMVMYYGKREE